MTLPAQIALSNDEVSAITKAWIEKAVIGLNLCPFAKTVYVKNQIHYVVSNANTSDALRLALLHELRALHTTDPLERDTTLLIHPNVLADFLDYNDFLDVADAALDELNLVGEIQIASFHPQYQFAGTAADDMGNYTNRSPFPILHLLREASIDRAVAALPEADLIYEKNIASLRELGMDGWQRLGLEIKVKTLRQNHDDTHEDDAAGSK